MGTRERLAEHYPMFALEVRTPRVTLRYPDDDDVLALAELAPKGVHTGPMPFTVPWTSVDPPFQQRNTLAFFWSQRTTAQEAEWALPLATVVDGEIVGTQGIMARQWMTTRTFETGSWLGAAHQGKGIGKEMRVAALHLGFLGFGAVRATTGAFDDNPSSLGVTRALGYRPNGNELHDRGGESVMLHRFFMERDDFDELRRDDIELVGAEETVALFGTAKAPAFESPSGA